MHLFMAPALSVVSESDDPPGGVRMLSSGMENNFLNFSCAFHRLAPMCRRDADVERVEIALD